MSNSWRRRTHDRSRGTGARRFTRPAAIVGTLCCALPMAATAVLPASAAAPASAEVGAGALAGRVPGGGRYVAEIERTEYGIPHILARDYGSLGYGYGYAFAQDNLCEMASRVLTVRGERSRYFGPGADSGDTLGVSADNLDSDVYYRGIRASGVLRRLLARPAPLGPTARARQLVAGYAAGYNRYLRDTGVAHLPDPTCRGQAWVTPITAADVWALSYDINTANGAAGAKQDIATASPPPAAGAAGAGTTGAATAGAGAVAAGPAAARVPVVNTSGFSSNGWALGRDATAAHDGMLLANPHVPWTGNARLYQVQLTIPGVLNAAGASLYGTPVVEFGHTRGLAWTATASHAQRFTLYRLALVPGDPTSYLVDGHAVAMTRRTVTVTVRGPSGTLSRVTRALYTSRYGPLLASGWTATTAYAIDDANADNVRSVSEWLAMESSQNLSQLRAAQDTYQGLPWLYTEATDTSGAVYFADASVAPHVTDAEANRCQAGGAPGRPGAKGPAGGTVVLDGSTSSCHWGSDPDAIEPGIFGPRSYPRLTRTDYAANSNNSPELANPSAPITGYPAAIYDSRAELELRPRLSLDMIARRLAGTDGYGPAGFTLPTLRETMLGQRNYSADLARAAVVAMCRAHPVLTASDGTAVNVRPACAVLAAWDGRARPGSRGEVLWRQAYGNLNYTDRWWRVPFDPAHPLTTPRDLNTSDPPVRSALADAVQFFAAHKIPLGIPLASTQHYAGIPLPGCTEGEGCFDRVEGELAAGNGVDTDIDNGSSFIMATELTPHGPVTRTILTYSESANPDSPHYRDQTVLFAHGQWVTERFTQAQINADPHRQITVLRS
jgi:acyl-homoserine-lactone acylase